MIILAKPTMTDLLLLCHRARPDEIEQYQALVGREWITDEVANDHYNRDGVKFVLLNDNDPIAAGGYDLIIDGVWQAWMVGTMDNWDQYWRSITKYTRSTMDLMLSKGARRLQVGALASRKQACEWYVRGLKMQPEGIMRGFGIHGEDMAMFSRLAEKDHGK